MLQSIVFALLAAHVAGHGWLVDPVSKIELVQRMRDYSQWQDGMPEEFRYCPDCSANGNNGNGHFDTPEANCGASSPVTAEGLSTWQAWYDAGGVDVAVLTPGSDFRVQVALPADHGGEFWIQLSCDTRVTTGTNWTVLERAANHRGTNYLSSNPGIWAWPPQSAGGSVETRYQVPSSFSCPSGEGIGRWVWKTGNTCNDANNIGRNTETFQHSELYWDSVRAVCAPGQAPETFIACFDYKLAGGAAPTAAPTSPPTSAPTSAPTPSPQPPPPPSPSGCSDSNQYCEDWAANGECASNSGWMSENCPASCGTCPTPAPCSDDNEHCGDWAANGECQNNANWMLENCAQSCGVCGLSAAEVGQVRVSYKKAKRASYKKAKKVA